MENGSRKIPSSTVPKPADHIRRADPIKGDRFVLEIFDQCSFEVGVEIVLQEDVQRLDDDLAVRGLR